jgi:ankyrin repeat protein
MSDSNKIPSLESLRREAKRLLRQCREKLPEALTRIRGRLPRFARLDDAAVAARLRLADVHQAMALERGHANWAELKAFVESQRPIQFQAERFLAAIRAETPRVARRLLVQHPTLSQQGIHVACAAGDAVAAEAWLRREPDLATALHEPEAWTPLIYLCASPAHAWALARAEGSRRCAELLLDHGASPDSFTLFNASDEHSKLSALYRACMARNLPVVRLLLERGADPNDGESVYHAAQQNLRDCLELLRAHGADLSGRHPHWGNTPLYFLAGHKEHDSGVAVATAGMRWLLEHGADPNVPSGESNETPLQRMAAGGRGVEAFELFLAHGADPNLARADGRTAYALAVRAGSDSVARLLRSRGADSAVREVDAFLGACRRADGTAARELLSAHPQLIAELTEEDRGSLCSAAQEGRLDSVRLMVELGFDLAWKGEMQATALHHAAWHGRVEATRLLLELGAPVDERDGEFGASALGWAAHGSSFGRETDEDYCAVIELLLAAGTTRAASINRWGEMPEGMASPRVAQLLRERGLGRD